MLEDKEQSRRDNWEDLQEQIQSLRDNHLAHLAADVTEIKVGMAAHKTDLEWLKDSVSKMQGVLTTVILGVLGSIIAAVINMLISYSK